MTDPDGNPQWRTRVSTFLHSTVPSSCIGILLCRTNLDLYGRAGTQVVLLGESNKKYWRMGADHHRQQRSEAAARV